MGLATNPERHANSSKTDFMALAVCNLAAGNKKKKKKKGVKQGIGNCGLTFLFLFVSCALIFIIDGT
jgi:hypothetical protein